MVRLLVVLTMLLAVQDAWANDNDLLGEVRSEGSMLLGSEPTQSIVESPTNDLLGPTVETVAKVPKAKTTGAPRSVTATKSQGAKSKGTTEGGSNGSRPRSRLFRRFR